MPSELGNAIEARRKQLGLSPTDLANAAGVTLQGLVPLRKGVVKTYQGRLTTGVCRALGWTPDSIDRLLAGLEPIELVTPLPAATAAETARLVALVRESQALLQQTIDTWRSQLAESSQRLDDQDSRLDRQQRRIEAVERLLDLTAPLGRVEDPDPSPRAHRAEHP